MDNKEKIKDSTGGRAAPKRDWTKGSISRNVLLISWPITIQRSSHTVARTLEMVWVGRLGAVSIAGMGVASTVRLFVVMVQQGLLMGVKAMVARFVGRGDAEGANRVAQQALVISTAFGVAVSIVGTLLAEPIMSIFIENLGSSRMSMG